MRTAAQKKENKAISSAAATLWRPSRTHGVGLFLPRTLQLDNTFTFSYRISLHFQQKRQQTKMSHLVALQRNVWDS